jgi:phosphatidylinositol kinase/protein kinase (PI-3  family)
VKKKASVSSKVQQFHQLRQEAVAELLEKRQELKRRLGLEVARFERLLEQNAKELAELGHRVKDSNVKVGKNLRLTDEEIQKELELVLSGKQLSLPSILQHLKIARSRFAAWQERHPLKLGKKGEGKLTVYFFKSGKR